MNQATLPAGMLRTVRALLAKAESTDYEAEAEALTAKAQELMVRHRIDQAVLSSAADRASEPTTRTVEVPSPYATAKAYLLGGIARANGCRALWRAQEGTSTVVGFPDELAATDELFTSLLVQATTALQREGPKRDARGRSRTVRFRRTFLVAFAIRIGQRLTETVDDVVTTVAEVAETAVVPLLEAREEATRAAVERMFPNARSFAPPATDREGWFAGAALADRANLQRDSRPLP